MLRLFVLLYCSILISLPVSSQKCTTPDEKPGSCVNIKYCASLVYLSQRKTFLSQLFLRLSKCCDSTGSTYCCPDDDYDEIVLPSEPPKIFASRFLLDEPCTTRQLEQGRCVPLENCRPLIELLKQGSYTVAKQQYMNERTCGFEGNKVKVCCTADLPEEMRKNGQNNNMEHMARNIPMPMIDPRQPKSGDKNDLPLQDNIGLEYLPDTTVCGITLGERIIGGKHATLYEFPWMALLVYQLGTDKGRKPDFLCGGMLISKNYVLTAAHCVSEYLISVRLGEYDIETDEDCDENGCNDPPIDVGIEAKIVHEYYNNPSGSKFNDIALLRLATEVTFTDFIKPICLPTTPEQRSKTYMETDVTVAGWGRTETAHGSSKLLKVNLKIEQRSKCSVLYRSLSNGQICAGGDRNKDSCSGDSGGPLMSSNMFSPNVYAVGMVSFGAQMCAVGNFPAIYTNVSYYMPWILSKLRP